MQPASTSPPAARRTHRIAFFTALVTAWLLPSPMGPAGPPAAQQRAQLPSNLDPLRPSYPTPAADALKAFGEAVRQCMDGKFDSAATLLADPAAADSSGLGDYVLFYRAKSLEGLNRKVEALTLLQRLESRYSSSSLVLPARLAQAQILVSAGKGDAALAALDTPALASKPEAALVRAQALEAAGRRREATGLQLRIYTEMANSPEADLAQKRLAVSDPSFAMRKANYPAMLLRAEKLIGAGRNREARTLLVRLSGVAAPDSRSRIRRQLLLARADLALQRSTEAVAVLDKIGPSEPDLHAQAIALEGTAFRKLAREKSLLAARDEALRLYPASPSAEELLYTVATYYDSQSRTDAACEAYRAIAERFPQGIYRRRALWKLAVVAFAQGRYRDALQGFSGRLAEESDSEDALGAAYWVARCYQKLNEPSKAAHLFERVQIIGNNHYYSLRAREAVRASDAAGTAAPGDGSGPDAEFQSALVRVESLRAGEAAMDRPSGAAAVAIDRARRLVFAGLPDLALDELREAEALSPGSKALSYVRARIYADEGDYYNVIVTLRRAFPACYTLPSSALPAEIWDLLFPVRFWQQVSQAAAANGLDPSLILGLMRQESAFRAEARSPADARGLMQVVPKTGRMLARQAGIRGYSTAKLYNPAINITLGSRYLNERFQRFEGKTELALAAYNAGDNRVDRWMKDFGSDDMAAFVELIPFSETRAYVKQVLTNQAHYAVRTESASPDLH